MTAERALLVRADRTRRRLWPGLCPPPIVEESDPFPTKRRVSRPYVAAERHEAYVRAKLRRYRKRMAA